MAIQPNSPWPTSTNIPMPAPDPWSSMNAAQVKEQIDRIDSRMAENNDRIATTQKNLQTMRKNSVMASRVTIGSYAAMFGGIIVGSAAAIMASPVIIGVIVASNVIGAASLIYNHRLRSKEDAAGDNYVDILHEQDMLQSRRDYASVKLHGAQEADARKNEEIKEDFQNLVKGVDKAENTRPVSDDELWLEVDGIKLKKHKD